jgi:hypothetical protein
MQQQLNGIQVTNMIYLLTTIFFLLQLFDWYSTSTILKAGGREQNPIMAFVFKYLNLNIALGVKSIVLTVVGFFLGVTPLVIQIKEIAIDFLIHYTWVLNIDFTIPAPLLLVFLIAIYSWVAYHNWKSL